MEVPLVPEMSKIPASKTVAAVMLPAPDRARVPPRILAVPLRLLAPVRVSVPALMARLPLPETDPEKVPEAAVSKSVRAPRLTAPLPLNVAMLILAVPASWEISSVALSTTRWMPKEHWDW